MNNYETMFVFSVKKGEESVKALEEKFTDLIAKNGEIIEIADWGKRHLAYPINDMNDGYYTVVTFKAEPSFPVELERLFNIDESIMRSIVLKLDHEPVAKAAAVEAEPAAEATETDAE